MKLAFSTLPCMDYGVKELIACCNKFNIEGIEIRAGNGNSILGETEDISLLQIGEKFAHSNIKVLCIGSSVCFKGYEPNKVKEAIEIIRRGKLVGACGIRIFLGNFARRFDSKRDLIDHDGIVRALKELCQYDKSFSIMVETHNEYATGKILSQLKNDVAEDNSKFIWDIVHPIEDGEDVETTWYYIGEHISHLHIKDGRKREDPIWHDYEYTLLGQGQLPIKDILHVLKKAGFKGFLSLEWESLWREELKQYSTDMNFLLTMFQKTISNLLRM